MEISYYEQALLIMNTKLEEKRSDICEFIEMVINNEPVEKLEQFVFEHRFVKTNFEGKEILYDTLTTEISIDNEILPCQYED